jgi:hypothetical protein
MNFQEDQLDMSGPLH